MVNKIDIEELKKNLSSSKIGDRRKSVKLIEKGKIYELSKDIFELYLTEKQKNKSWEIQCELIKVIDILQYKPAIEIIESICLQNLERDMITSQASSCYLTLARENLHDIKPILKLFSYGKFSVIDGLLRTIVEDNMSFSENEHEAIILYVNKFSPKKDKGYSDIRIGLANACAGWIKSKIITDFLEKCLSDSDSSLNKVATNASKGKYSDIE